MDVCLHCHDELARFGFIFKCQALVRLFSAGRHAEKCMEIKRRENGEGGRPGRERKTGEVGGQKNKIKPCESHALFSPHSLTLHQTAICPPFKETWIFLIPSLIKITYIKECVRLHQGFHLFYNEVNAETQWLPQQCKWRPNDNLHYLNKVIAITLRYSNEDRYFELSALNSLLLLQNIWKRRRRIDFGLIQCVSSNSMWCKPRAMSKAKSLNVVVQEGRGRQRKSLR